MFSSGQSRVHPRVAASHEHLHQTVDCHCVKQILQSRTFHKELDDVICDQMNSGPNAALHPLQQSSDLHLPQGHAFGD
jgi:hypothetical protein